jgi:hypothetical protein
MQRNGDEGLPSNLLPFVASPGISSAFSSHLPSFSQLVSCENIEFPRFEKREIVSPSFYPVWSTGRVFNPEPYPNWSQPLARPNNSHAHSNWTNPGHKNTSDLPPFQIQVNTRLFREFYEREFFFTRMGGFFFGFICWFVCLIFWFFCSRHPRSKTLNH